MLPWYGMRITVRMALLACLCTLSASAFIEASLNQFFLETFYEDLVLKYFSSEKVNFPAMVMKLVTLSVLVSYCESGYEGRMLVWVITPSRVRYPMWPEGEI